MVHSVITKIAANREHLDFTPKILLSGKSMIFRKKKKKKKNREGLFTGARAFIKIP